MSTKFTANQQQAIETGITASDKHNVLVSASAGSGKTTVLIERIMHEIDAGTDIDQLLVVTFTELAAKHMKDKLEQRLTAQVRELQAMSTLTDEQQTKLSRYRRQLSLIGVANISTLHAFCLQVIRRYYYVIDLDPGFRLLTDDTERLLMRDQVWEAVREQLYTDDGENFERLVANFSGDRDDEGLTALVNRVFDFSQATPDPAVWLDQLVSVYDLDNQAPFTSSQLYQKEIQPLLQQSLTGVLERLQPVVELAEQNNLVEATIKSLKNLIKATQTAQQALKTEPWNTIRDSVNAILDTKPRIKKKYTDQPELEPVAEQVSAAVDDVKKTLKGLSSTYLTSDESTIKETLLGAKFIIQELVRAVKLFAAAFTKEKRQKHVLDFNDLEHLTLQILSATTDGTENARTTLQARFSEIMVDEYQDTNQLQEKILQTIAAPEPGNMFMVGDVKQSIYQFRLADPSLFLAKYASYGPQSPHGERIILAENFRSVNNIDQFVNLIFKQLMDRPVGQMEYDQDAELQYGAKYYADAGPDLPQTTEVLVYETGGQAADDSDDETEDSFDFGAKVEGPIAVVADKIKELRQSNKQIYDAKAQTMRPLQYSDIALLVPTRSNNLAITEVFKRAQIPIVVRDTQNYFRATEIRIMMSMLSIIDNPYQDIPLVAVLRSPMVGLDENQLVYLRIYNRTSDYFQSLRDFYQQYPTSDQQSDYGNKIYQKVATLMDWLTEFRDLARQNQLVTLIWRIYERTGFLDYVGGMPAGPQRQANLHALYERAHDYEQSSFKGLFQFVRFIERMQARDQDLAEAAAETNTEAVQVMTIHGSKGLEFPVVFLMDATHQFNQRDTMGNAIIDRDFGLGITYLNPTQRISYDTLPKVVASNYLATKNRAEEMRKLYVALTRAEQQLYVVGAYASKEQALKQWQLALNSPDTVLQASARQRTKNLMDWIGMALLRVPGVAADLGLADEPVQPINTSAQFKIEFYQFMDLQTTISATPDSVETDQLPAIEGQGQLADLTEETQQKIVHILNFDYPYQDATQTTAYQSVSEVKRLFEDPDTAEMQPNPTVNSDGRVNGNRYVTDTLAVPHFLQQDTVEKPSAAAVGTATHLVLERLDLQGTIDQTSIQALVDQLVADQVLAPAVAAAIPQTAILKFFASDLGQTLISRPRLVQREVPFSLLLPANQLFNDFQSTDHGKVLIHGIIDGYVQTPDGLILFDYKTDHVHRAEDLLERYAGQVNLYATALSSMAAAPIAARYLYSLTLNELIPVPAKSLT